jgi:hypothetical protein
MKQLHLLLLSLFTFFFLNNTAIACVGKSCTQHYATGISTNGQYFTEAALINKKLKKQVRSFLDQHNAEKTLSKPLFLGKPHQYYYRKYSFENSQFYFEVVQKYNNYAIGGDISDQARVYLSMKLDPKYLLTTVRLDKNESLQLIKEFGLNQDGLTFEGYLNYESDPDKSDRLQLEKISFKIINGDTVEMTSTMRYMFWMPFFPYNY